jgi:hypothetical protein
MHPGPQDRLYLVCGRLDTKRKQTVSDSTLTHYERSVACTHAEGTTIDHPERDGYF